MGASWFEAAEKGNQNFLQNHINEGIKTKNEKGETALMICSRNGHTTCVNLLLDEMMMTDNNRWTALIHAASKNNVECVKLLLPEMKITTNLQQTALMISSENGHQNCVELLLYEMKIADEAGDTALMHATCKNQVECVKLLLPEMGMVNNDNETALHKACFYGYPECAKLLLREAEFINKENQTPLDIAQSLFLISSEDEYMQCVKLIENNLQKKRVWFEAAEKGDYRFLYTHQRERLKTKNEKGETALMICAREGHANCISLLQGEMNMANADGDTALMYAACKNQVECVKLLLPEMGMVNNHNVTALHIVCFCGYPECAKLLVDEAEFIDKDGQTPLYIARNKFSKCNEYNYLQCVKLIENYLKRAWFEAAEKGDYRFLYIHLKERLKTKNENGQTSLMICAREGHANCISLLQGEMKMTDKDGWTALIYAAYSNQFDCVKLLFPEIRITDKWNQTALMISAGKGHKICVELLLCEMNMKDNNGQTALMHAATKNHFDCIKLLLPEMKMVDKWNQSALMFSAECGHQSCVQLLLSEMKMVDNEKKTALHKACFCGRPECVELLLEEAEFVDVRGKTPLDVAKSQFLISSEDEYMQCVKVIREYLQKKQDTLAMYSLQQQQITQQSKKLPERPRYMNTITVQEQNQRLSQLNFAEQFKITGRSLQQITTQPNLQQFKHIHEKRFPIANQFQIQGQQNQRVITQNYQQLISQQPMHYAQQAKQLSQSKRLQLRNQEAYQDLPFIEQQWENEHSTIAKLLQTDTINGSNATYTGFKHLGKTQNSFTYIATRQDGKEVVLKVTDITGGMYKYVKREASIQEIQHPNISRIHDAFLVKRDEDTFGVIIMDRALPFAQVFPNGMNKIQLRGVVVDIIYALSYLHGLYPQIIHRDVKPDNIMIMQLGVKRRAVLIDFNACIITVDRTADTDIGCQQFQAPEINGNKYDDRVDAFSLGKTIQVWIKQFYVDDDELYQLSKLMCSDDPNFRPKSDSVVLFLQGDIELDEIELDERK